MIYYMRKIFTIAFVLFISQLAIAQTDQIAPTLTDTDLINFLQNNYSVTNSLGYNSGRDAMFNTIDKKDGQIRCVYTGYTITFSNRQDAQNKGFNTEHTWPQSFFDQESTMRSDIHHLFPTRVDVNGARSNFDFDEIPDDQTDKWYEGSSNQTTKPGANIDDYSELLNNTAFEPREDHKGNVARAVFYFWTIYQDDSDIINDGTDNEAFFNRMKNVLLEWHDADPVDDTEIARSLAIEGFQGNRNPFVHDTTLVRRAYFGGGIIEPADFDNPLTGKVSNIQSQFFDVDYKDEGVDKSARFLYANDFVAKDTADMAFTLTDYEMIEEVEVEWEAGIAEGEYFAKVLSVIKFEEDKDTVIVGPTASVKALLISGVIDATLSGGTPKAVELFATEDIPDLGVFAIGSANNGGGSDGVEYTLSGSVAKGDYIYVATESTNFDTWFGFEADFVDDFSVAVNGDDAVELFYDTTKAFSGTEIVVDTFGQLDVNGDGTAWEYTDGWAYRMDFSGPDSTSFNIDNWFFSGPSALDGASSNADADTPFPVGTFKFEVGTNNEFSEESPEQIRLLQNYPNPFNPSTNIEYQVANSGLVTLRVYDLVGREVASLVNEYQASGLYTVTFNAGNLSSGIYVYRLSTNDYSLTQKMSLIK